jgi:predicted RNA binding protein YcfA (HicA-like mRNA interferase family)
VSPKRLPVVSGARVVRALEKDGFDIIGTKGSHCKLRRGSRTVIVSPA